MIPDKLQIMVKFQQWIGQKPELEYVNYGDPSAYRSEYRSIVKEKKRAETALALFARMPYSEEYMQSALRSFMGRLKFDEKGELDYCVGWYWPTEYRKVVAVVLETYNEEMGRIFYTKDHNYGWHVSFHIDQYIVLLDKKTYLRPCQLEIPEDHTSFSFCPYCGYPPFIGQLGETGLILNQNGNEDQYYQQALKYIQPATYWPRKWQNEEV